MEMFVWFLVGVFGGVALLQIFYSFYLYWYEQDQKRNRKLVQRRIQEQIKNRNK